MKFEILNTLNFDDYDYCEPFHEIAFTFKGKTKKLKIGCSAWKHYQKSCIDNIKKDWENLK